MKRKETYLKRKLSDEKLTICQDFKQKLFQNLQTIERKNSMASQPKPHPQLNIRQLTKQKSFLYATGFAVLAIAAVGIYAIDNRSQNLARQSEIEDVVELPQTLDNVLGIDEMRTLAGTDAPAGTTVEKVELENEHGAVLYKVKFSDGSFRLYDAVTGLAYVEPADDNSENDDSIPADFVPGITMQQARDIAQAKREGKTITKIELDTENGIVVYSVRFSDDGRVDVNATDGSVVRVKEPDQKDDDNESEDSSKQEDGDDNDDNSGSSSNSGTSGSGSTSDDSKQETEDEKEDDDKKSGSGSSNSGSGSNSGSNSSDDDKEDD